MFCSKCGAQITDGINFCPVCNAAQTAQAQRQGGYSPPDLETKVVQVYPGASHEAEAITVYEKCGWKVVSSNRSQELEYGMTSTFIRITLQRDRNMPNYAKIKALSDDPALSSIGTIPAQGKFGDLKKMLFLSICFLHLIIPFVIVVKKMVKLKRKNKENRDQHAANKQKAFKIADECQQLINSGKL